MANRNRLLQIIRSQITPQLIRKARWNAPLTLKNRSDKEIRQLLAERLAATHPDLERQFIREGLM